MPVKSDSDFKQFFYELASLEKDVRIKAANELLSYLQTKVAVEEVSEYHQYCVERLVKGLASSRDAARQGFSVTLCEVLKFGKVTVDKVLAVMDQHMLVSSLISLFRCSFLSLLLHFSDQFIYGWI
jgi:DNA polymerase phi